MVQRRGKCHYSESRKMTEHFSLATLLLLLPFGVTAVRKDEVSAFPPPDAVSCTMCSSCDNPCPVNYPPPPPPHSSNCPPPPSATTSYSPPPPSTITYYSPPPPGGGSGGGVGHYYPPPYGGGAGSYFKTPPPPHPIMPYFPYYFYSPPPPARESSSSLPGHQPVGTILQVALFGFTMSLLRWFP